MGRFSVGKLPGINVVRYSSEENEKLKFDFSNKIEERHIFTVSQYF